MVDGVSMRLGLARSQWRLGERQVQVLELLAGGATNKEIAVRLARSEVTVEKHVTESYRRAGARSRTDLVRKLFTLDGV
jgi:DNA-binding NarL/FixJ family response regulator